ncbi:malonic semialdehyde reductase [Nocardioides flavus (ex Wang et al. 2016)]|nr:malonic semialdehyde reductase [Nocardioides flavus (ex Wang et al. 2016)]
MTDSLALSPEAQALLFRDARTPNAFTDEPVTDEQVAAIYDLVKYAPTAMNTQPLRIVLVREDDARERLLKVMADGNRDKTANAPLVAILAADTDFHDHLPRTFPHFPGAREVFADPVGREEAARFNATLQIGYFLLGVRAVGLAAGPMGGFDAEALDAEFFAGTSLKSLLVVNLGRPGENAWYDRLPRLEHDEVVREA